MNKNQKNGTCKLLIVDDEDEIRKLICRILEKEGYLCNQASTGEEALQKIDTDSYHLVVLDIGLPSMNGVDILKKIVGKEEEIAVVMLTGLHDLNTGVECMKIGAYDYLSKPIHNEGLLISVSRALERRLHIRQEIEHKQTLENEVLAKTRHLEKTIKQLQSAKKLLEERVSEIIHRLSLVAEYRDEDTWKHLLRISHYSYLIAEGMELSQEFCQMLKMASPLHDVGKVGIADSILLKPDRLTDEEYNIIKQHTVIGANILKGSKFPLLNMAHDIALNHHERWDGNGYPHGFHQDEIPLAGRIVAVVDVFDALTSQRPYKPAWSFEETIDTIRDQRGRQFDPEVIDAFLSSIDQVQALFEKSRAISDKDALFN